MVTLALAYFRTRDLDALAAAGFSPEQLAFSVNHPEQMIGNFPSGIVNNLNSLLYNIYPPLHRAGFSITHVWAMMILIEIAAFAAAAMYAIRSLVPDADWRLAAVVAITYVASSFLTPDMANLGFPFYGWVYAFAHACFLVAAGAVVRGRFYLTAIALIVCFAIHPIIGVFTGAFVGALVAGQLWDGERLPLRGLLAAAALSAAGCGAWLLFIIDSSTVSTGAVDAATFVALNRAQNFHWFPSYLGLYWERYWQMLVPLLSSFALFAWAYDRCRPMVAAGVARQIALGVVVLIALTCLGLVIAEFAPWPPLIKLALHRADRNALIAAGLLVFPAVFRDVIEGDAVERVLATLLIATPFISGTGLEALPVALRVAFAAFRARRQNTFSAALFVALALLTLIAVLLVFYAANGLMSPSWTSWGWHAAAVWLLVAAAPLIIMRLDGQSGGTNTASRLATLLLAGVMIGALTGSPSQQAFGSEEARKAAYGALESQLWLRDNSLPGSILMPDPALNYFGRDKSQRPSFGTPREWLLISIIYDTRKDLLDEGMRRYRALGLAAPDFIFDPANRRTEPMLRRINNDASLRFYAMTAGELLALARTYNIRYFVYQKARLSGVPPLPVVYQNDYFVITTAG